MKRSYIVLWWTILLIPGIALGQTYQPDLYLVSIGVSNYHYYPEAQLNFADSDALAIDHQFIESAAYQHTTSVTLLNENATRANILSVHEKLMHTTVDDQVILFFSRHGFLDMATANFYICPNTFQLDHPDSTGVRFEELEGLLDGIPARRRLLLIDACNSGEVDPETFDKMKRSWKPGLEIVRGKKAFVPVNAKNRKTKTTQGLFTYALLHSLQPGLTLKTLVDQTVSKVSEIAGNTQVPFVREENDQFDYVIW